MISWYCGGQFFVVAFVAYSAIPWVVCIITNTIWHPHAQLTNYVYMVLRTMALAYAHLFYYRPGVAAEPARLSI
jgi:uncharacterized membrane protein